MAPSPDPAPDPAPDPVATDPFWSVVRRRHPDVDLVLLPPVREPAPPPGPPGPSVPSAPAGPSGTVPSAEELSARARSAWASYLSGGSTPSTDERWIPGPGRTHRREVVLTADGVDPVAAAAALRVAGEELRGDGWHVLEPDDGWPRVLAGRQHDRVGGAGREELHLIFAPSVAGGRLVLRLRGLPSVTGGQG